MSEPSSPCTPPSAFPNGKFSSTIVVAGSSTFPTRQCSTAIECTFVTLEMPATLCVPPVRLTSSSFATLESTSDCDAPVSSANVYGPFPLIVTGTSAITCLPCFSTLIATLSEPSGFSVGGCCLTVVVEPQPERSRAAAASVSRDPFTSV